MVNKATKKVVKSKPGRPAGTPAKKRGRPPGSKNKIPSAASIKAGIKASVKASKAKVLGAAGKAPTKGRASKSLSKADAIKRTAEAYKNDVPMDKIIKDEGVTRQAIYLRLKLAGVKPRKTAKYDDKFVQKAADLYKKLKSAKKVAEKIGCPVATVYVMLRRAGVEAGVAGGHRDEAMLQRTADMYLGRGKYAKMGRRAAAGKPGGGLSTNEISRLEGVAQSAVVSRLKRAGVALRPKTKAAVLARGPADLPAKAAPARAAQARKAAHGAAPVGAAPKKGRPRKAPVALYAEDVPPAVAAVVEAAAPEAAPAPVVVIAAATPAAHDAPTNPGLHVTLVTSAPTVAVEPQETQEATETLPAETFAEVVDSTGAATATTPST